MPEQTGSTDKQTPWWDKLPPSVGGDSIVANVGAHAQGVAVGKNIQQTVASTLGAPTPDDKKFIEQRFDEISANLDKTRKQLDATTATMADFQLKLLKGELTKTGEKETPSATTITTVGTWLLDNVPSMAGEIIGLFTNPIVGKVVGKAGEGAVTWARERFGSAGAQAGTAKP